jgi:pimeloyl-ACP methyl ester carboxylesterase
VNYIESGDHAEIFTPHLFPEQIVDLGEIRMNYAVAGDPANPAVLLIPGQTESWWGYEDAMRLLAEHYQVYAVDLRGQGRSSWTPGRYSLDLFGNDLVRFIDCVIGRPVVAGGLSSGGVIAAWLSAFAKPGQIRAAVYEDAPLFASEANPAVGTSIRQGVAGVMFRLWHKYLGAQWSIGDEDGLRAAMAETMPSWIVSAMASAAAEHGGQPLRSGPMHLREYDPEWGDAFYTGRVALTCDHEAMLRQVKVPVLFTHHSHRLDLDTGNLIGAISDQQVQHVRRLVEGTGNSFTYREFPDMPHSMHGHSPSTYVQVVTEWIDQLDAAARSQPVAALGRPIGKNRVPADKGVDGTWKLTIKTPAGTQEATLTLAASGTELTGTLDNAVLESGTVDGQTINFKAHLTVPAEVEINCAATVDGNEMVGQAKVTGMPLRASFTGTPAEMS